MRGWFRSLAVLAVVAELWTGLSAFSPTPTEIKLALQEGGTASWEAAAMRELKLDEKNGVKLEIRNVADSQASQVALQAGEVEVILSDFVWTSLQRDQGGDLTFVPHSLAVGGLLAMPGGKLPWRLRVGRSTRDLTKDTKTNFGAPPLVNEQLSQRQADAILNFWHFNARALVAGASQIISVVGRHAPPAESGSRPAGQSATACAGRTLCLAGSRRGS
jgi:NitT/TauT family transport system substrate-binding protein